MNLFLSNKELMGPQLQHHTDMYLPRISTHMTKSLCPHMFVLALSNKYAQGISCLELHSKTQTSPIQTGVKAYTEGAQTSLLTWGNHYLPQWRSLHVVHQCTSVPPTGPRASHLTGAISGHESDIADTLVPIHIAHVSTWELYFEHRTPKPCLDNRTGMDLQDIQEICNIPSGSNSEWLEHPSAIKQLDHSTLTVASRSHPEAAHFTHGSPCSQEYKQTNQCVRMHIFAAILERLSRKKCLIFRDTFVSLCLLLLTVVIVI